ncbi:hypothetical protein NYP18_00305 [Corynebacterium sp. YIM 101645]|uniref:Secreted protein n=1 Tax=Corynebacterium lemuris TaxID=1859292 RepID=A0ABT2FSB4_9CORY|nr:hypothetical protein [Corynebacterium lemuris]MCS5478095.1 hypothetical protein [Corynebacterium lemuris]
MLSRTLISLFTAAAVGGGVLAAPAQAAPTGSSLGDLVQKNGVEGPLTQNRYRVLAGIPATITPLKTTLPAGTTLSLQEGAELDGLIARGWSITINDNVMAVTPSINAEGYCAIPAVVNHPDGSDESVDIVMYVDFPLDLGFLGSAFNSMSSQAGPQGWLC